MTKLTGAKRLCPQRHCRQFAVAASSAACPAACASSSRSSPPFHGRPKGRRLPALAVAEPCARRKSCRRGTSCTPPSSTAPSTGWMSTSGITGHSPGRTRSTAGSATSRRRTSPTGRRRNQRRPPPRAMCGAKVNTSRTWTRSAAVRAGAAGDRCLLHTSSISTPCAQGLRGPASALLLLHRTPRGRAARLLRVLQHVRHTMGTPNEVSY